MFFRDADDFGEFMEFFDEIIAVLEQEKKKKARLYVDVESLNELAQIPVGKSERNIVATPQENAPKVSDTSSVIDESFSENLAKHIQSTPVDVQGNSAVEIQKQLCSCSACELSKYRQHVVAGSGNSKARLMFIGEVPSASDDAENRIFSGEVGELLDKMIVAMGFNGREEVYLTTLIKCRPPGNRVADKFEVEKCIGYLKKEIEFISPEAIVVFGANTVKYLLGKEGTISELRGKMLYYENIPLMPTFNPAYLLRKASAKREVWQDLQEIMKVLGMKK